MSYYDPFGRRYRPMPSRRTSYAGDKQPGGAQPTLDDYRRLLENYQALQSSYEEKEKKLHVTEEALREQTKKAIELHEAVQTSRSEIEQLRGALSHVASRNQANDGDWQERFSRLQAETENYRRRLEQRIAADAAQQRNQLLEDMLALADHLEMAIQHLDRPVEPSPSMLTNESAFRQSLEATLHAFLETLRKYGVQPIDAVGQPFNPAQHEAMGQMIHPEIPADHVAAVVRTGYVINEQLLRPAQVMVSRGAANES